MDAGNAHRTSIVDELICADNVNCRIARASCRFVELTFKAHKL